MIYVVVNEESGLVGAFLDEAEAIACAQYRQGVIANLNIAQDFRPVPELGVAIATPADMQGAPAPFDSATARRAGR